jgi:hypothetical protein
MVDASSHGTTVSLVLALEEFAYAEDLVAFNSEMISASANTLPVWQSNGTIKGAYWLEIGQEPKTVIKSLKLAEWEKIVAQVERRPDFAYKPYFYTIDAILPVGGESLVSDQNGFYKLSPGREYELRIPKGDRLYLEKSSPWLTFVTNPSVVLDSRYDLKRVRFKTGRPSAKEVAVLTIQRGNTSGPSGLEFDLPLEIRGTFWSTLGYGIALGALLAAPQIIAAFSNPNLPSNSLTVISIASLLFGLCAGIMGAFGLKKTI